MFAVARCNDVTWLNVVSVGSGGVIWPHCASGRPQPSPAGPWPGRARTAVSPPPYPGMAVVADSQHLPAVVVALPAEIDMANAGRVGQQLGSAFAPGVSTVIADMTATTFCDSSGIGMLVRAHKQAAATSTQLRLVVPSAAVVQALTLVQMDYLLPIYPSLSQALTAAPQPGPHARHE
jgi:anti-sigma B factor antagonist